VSLEKKTLAVGADQQAGLQALIWKEVTPNFTLTSTDPALVPAYGADVAALVFGKCQEPFFTPENVRRKRPIMSAQAMSVHSGS
jgi:hypothetical protein